jgi:NADPH:quinone reductase-like Zn-dependent oxidoreductase
VKSAYIDALGDAASIRCGELPDPIAGPDQVLVRVDAVAVNNVDTFVRSGRWPTEVGFPLAMGRDLVGTVAAVGTSVTDLEPGQRVWTNSAGYGGRAGATAELVPVDRDRLYELPAQADPVSFVAAVHPGASAHGALVGRARLRAGECMAVVGANGSVGMCMVQVAARLGAEAIAVIRDERASDRLRALGAPNVVIAQASDAPHAAAEAASSGIDVFVDTTRHVDLTAVPERLSPRGRIVLVAAQGRMEVDLWQFYTNEIQLLGFIMSAMTRSELAAAAEWINGTYRSRPLSVSVSRVLGFEDAGEAHAMLESGQLPRMNDGTVGRLVLRP